MISAKNLTLLAGLAAVSFAGTAANAQLTSGPFTSVIPTTLTPWGPLNETVQKFNPALGTLDAVCLTLNGNAQSTVTITATTASTFFYTAGATIRLTRPDGTFLTQVIPTISVGDVFTPIALAAGNKDIRTGSATATSGVQTFNSAADLALFTGPGTISLPAQAIGSVTSTLIGGNATAGQVTNAGADIRVLYKYHTNASVPEPGSVAMLIAGGMTGAGFFVRRRNKK